MTGLIPWRKKQKDMPVPFTHDFDSMYERFFREPFLPLKMFTASDKWLPRIDIRDKDNRIVVTAEIPGMDKEAIDVSLKGRFLTIKGEKTTEDKKEKKGFFRRERSYGFFERSVQLPDEVDEASVKAKYKRGVLTLDMKKMGKYSAKTIPVGTGKKYNR